MPPRCAPPSHAPRQSTVAQCRSWTSGCARRSAASRSRSRSRKAASASSGASRRRWDLRSSGCTAFPTGRCGSGGSPRENTGGSPLTKSRPSSDCMDLRDRTVMILGGSGLVGHAVARRLLGAAPRRVVLVALFEEEGRATARALEPYRGRATLEVEWGNVFLPAGIAQLERGSVMANAEHRRLLVQDLLSELTDDVLQRSFLYQLLLKYKPDAVVDSINTATAFAYQDALRSAQDLLALARRGEVDEAAVERRAAAHVAAADPARSDPGRVAQACRDESVREDRYERHRGHGVQHSLHALRGASQQAPPHQVCRGGCAITAAVSAGSHARRSRGHRDQAHRHHRLARDRLRADPPQRKADPAGGLPETSHTRAGFQPRRRSLVRSRQAARRCVHRRGGERSLRPR